MVRGDVEATAVPDGPMQVATAAALGALGAPAALAVIVMAIATTAVLAAMLQPFTIGPVGFDSAASVIHFDRIASGVRLEAFVTATPKPLLTMVYGGIHAVVPDWRAISIAALCTFAVSAALVSVLVARAIPGSPRFVPILTAPLVLLGSRLLVTDLGLAYAAVWALLGWAIAGHAALGPRPRPWLVGAGLMLATLARLETVVVTAVLALGLVWHLARRRPWRSASGWNGRGLAAATAIAAGALPVMLVHDWLLTGDPLFWARVSTAYSEATSMPPTAVQIARALERMLLSRPIPAALAAVGLLALWRPGSRPLLAGLLALGPGLGLLLVGLAARGTYVSTRYFAGIEIALAVAAAVGAAAIAAGGSTIAARRSRGLPGSRRRPATTAVAWSVGAIVAIAAVLGGPFAPLDAGTSSTLASQRAMAQVGDRSDPVVAGLLAGQGLRAGQPKPADAAPILFVPSLLRPRMAVDLDLPLWAVAGLGPSVVAIEGNPLRAGDVVVHSARFDQPVGGYVILESGGTVRIGDRILQTVATPDAGTWVLRVP